jgi:hypothetical protein
MANFMLWFQELHLGADLGSRLKMTMVRVERRLEVYQEVLDAADAASA